MTTLRAASPRLVLGLLVVAVAVWLAFNRDRLDPALMESAIRGLGLWAPLGHIVLFALGTTSSFRARSSASQAARSLDRFGGRCLISSARHWVPRLHSSLRATSQRIGSDEGRAGGSIA